MITLDDIRDAEGKIRKKFVTHIKECPECGGKHYNVPIVVVSITPLDYSERDLIRACRFAYKCTGRSDIPNAVCSDPSMWYSDIVYIPLSIQEEKKLIIDRKRWNDFCSFIGGLR